MQLETFQIYAMFSMLTAAAILIGLSYCSGLKTGRESGYKQGREAATRYWNGLMKGLQGQQTDLRRKLSREEQQNESIRTQLDAARTALHQEQAEHKTITQDLLDALERERGNSLTLDDCQALRRAARLLGHSADVIRKSGTTKTNQAAEAQSQVTSIAERLHAALAAPKLVAQMADNRITDTDLIEWLNKRAACWRHSSSVALEFPVVVPAGPLPHIRNILTLAVERHRARETGNEIALSTWERIDAEYQPDAPMCM